MNVTFSTALTSENDDFSHVAHVRLRPVNGSGTSRAFLAVYRSWTPGESGHIYELTVEHDADFEYFAAFDL